MPVLTAGDLAVEIDFNTATKEDVLHKLKEGKWELFLVDGENITSARLRIEELPPGKYRFLSID